MAKSKFEYVKKFEMDDRCLPECWIVVRVDGRGFHRFTELHGFAKPNDARGLRLMNRAAESVLHQFGGDVIAAYGQSDEYSFVFRHDTALHNRRASKLVTCVLSTFTARYVFHWAEFFGPGCPLRDPPPTFDARLVLYPNDRILRDYLSWRQADCHVNNLYNTAFWALVLRGGLDGHEAQEALKGTTSADKNEMLFARFRINYNDEPPMYRKGTVLVRAPRAPDGTPGQVQALHVDIIRNDFWDEHPELLSQR